MEIKKNHLFSYSDIRILPPPTSTLVVGQNTTFVCEISDQLGYFNPTWLGPGGTPVNVRSGKFIKTYAGIRYRCIYS